MAKCAVLAATVLVFACTGCGQRCVNREIGSHPSPSGKKTALVFSRECGPGADANVQVSVMPATANMPNVPGNAFIVGGKPALTVRWQSNETLTVSGFGTAKVFKQETAVGDTTIYYQP